jgi:predicted DsbA family dithiol-disulfide isomerase
MQTSPTDTAAAPGLVVDVISDVVCPWCYIGKRKLEAALSELRAREPDLHSAVRWHPFQLNPDLPAEGVDRLEYLEAKFGSKARSDEIYARVKRVGKEVGIDFEFDRIARVPNTLAAHSLIAWTQHRGDPGATEAVVEMLFRAFFVEGRLLNERAELARIASEAGIAWTQAQSSSELRAEVEAEDREARGVGINGVPFFIFNGKTAVAGAHDPETLLKAIAAARSSD